MEYQKNGISKKWNDVLQGAEHLRALENGMMYRKGHQKHALQCSAL